MCRFKANKKIDRQDFDHLQDGEGTNVLYRLVAEISLVKHRASLRLTFCSAKQVDDQSRGQGEKTVRKIVYFSIAF